MLREHSTFRNTLRFNQNLPKRGWRLPAEHLDTNWNKLWYWCLVESKRHSISEDDILSAELVILLLLQVKFQHSDFRQTLEAQKNDLKIHSEVL